MLRSMKFEHFTRYYLYLRGSIEFVVVFCIRPTALAIFVLLPVNKELEPVNLEMSETKGVFGCFDRKRIAHLSGLFRCLSTRNGRCV